KISRLCKSCRWPSEPECSSRGRDCSPPDSFSGANIVWRRSRPPSDLDSWARAPGGDSRMMWFRPSCRIAFVSTLLTGCYTAELDSGWSAVFVCEEDLDCALGQACVGGVCLSEEDAV